jgi:hypothetical protein
MGVVPGVITSPKREEALTLAKDRLVEYKTVRSDANVISEPNLYERTPYITLDESLFHVVKNEPNEDSGGIIILERNLEIHTLLNTPKGRRSRY